MKLVIVSNRLPVTLSGERDALHITRSGGGLATGLDSLETGAEKHWMGWPGLYVEDDAFEKTIQRELTATGLHPVFLSGEQISEYYEGYSNSTIWPLCHYFFSYINYDPKFWKAYREVNALFCREILRVAEPDDFVWVHDYHLMLVPGMLRKQAPELAIGYFHHIPFPSYEMFRCLPERSEILKGLLGADLIGFHTYEYMRHFISASFRVLNAHCRLDEITLNNRTTRVDAFPMGINYDVYSKGPESPEAESFAEELRQLAGDCKIILSVDRLDYSKGILTRLKAYAGFLETYPEYRGRVTLVIVVMPSRDSVDVYAELKVEIDTMIGYINGLYASIGWLPIHYFYRSFGFDELCAMYTMTDIALVTPLRDGMNLVAKEFAAAKRDRPGVLILSEMAGASIELPEALIVNPTDTSQIETALHTALTMTAGEQMERLQSMQQTVKRQNVNKWARDFFRELGRARDNNRHIESKRLEKEGVRDVVSQYHAASNRLLVIDYDSTLTPPRSNPVLALTAQKLRDLLSRLAEDGRNTVAVCSGKDKDTLEQWFGPLPLFLAAEHGAFFRENGVWTHAGEKAVWDDEILEVFQNTVERTPRSRLERKNTALIWHYREVDPWLADLRTSQLLAALVSPSSRLGLQITPGRKTLSVKPAEFTKGKVMAHLFERGDYDFILALSDDTPDEDMFNALPENAISIREGAFSENALYWLEDSAQTLAFLEKLLLRPSPLPPCR